MSLLQTGDIVRALGPALRARSGSAAGGFRRVVIDSRVASPGDLFVALRGERVDGHDYIADAAGRGATGVIAERVTGAPPDGLAVFEVDDSLRALQWLAADWRAHRDVRVVGVTGSVGKTSCKEMIASVLATRYAVHRNEANQNNEVGLPLAVLAIEDSHEIAVLEMGMYALGEIALLAEIARPTVGVVTNVGPIHLERLGSIEAIAEAKAELVRALPPEGLAVLNGDDGRVAAMARACGGRVAMYGESAGCDVRGSDVVTHGLGGASFTLRHAGEAASVRTAVPGRVGVHNALAAAAVAIEFEMPLGAIAAALAKVHPYRLVTVAGPNGSTLLDDTYNASPPSVLAALDLLGELGGRRIAVLGDMLELGAYEEQGHREVGERAASTADALIAVGERAATIAAGARGAGLADVRHFATKEGIAAHLRKTLREGDHVLFKGSRGMALETLVAELAGAGEDGESRHA